MSEQNQNLPAQAGQSTPAVPQKNAIMNVKALVESENVKKRFTEILDKEANGFCANLAVMVNNSVALQKCEPLTVVASAIIAASLRLPIDPNLGFAAIVPYSNKQKDGSYKDMAQFQMMWRGYVQLAIRSGLYKNIHVTEVYKDELKMYNPLTDEIEFTPQEEWKMRYQVQGGEIVGYYAYFKLHSGFEKGLYKSRAEVDKHGKKFSKTYAKGYGKWVDDFDSMGRKTVLKMLLSRWGILSIEIQKAIKYDQGVVTEITEDAAVEYVDNNVDVQALSGGGVSGNEAEKVASIYEEAPETVANSTETEPAKYETAEPAKSTKGRKPGAAAQQGTMFNENEQPK